MHRTDEGVICNPFKCEGLGGCCGELLLCDVRLPEAMFRPCSFRRSLMRYIARILYRQLNSLYATAAEPAHLTLPGQTLTRNRSVLRCG